MSGPNGRSRLLIGKKAITDYLQIGDNLFYELIKFGMPARAVNKRWMTTTDNLDEFFRVFTRVDNRRASIPEDAE